ncbi:sugar kinase [Sporolactobacillus terrae]|uniref:2-dehydro-3-deoxygluconokinase n=1 Tax=Sporolactobacillus terrae TaxID=269673 RepID=A0A5K7WTA9_9BACL|nr:sugar kinase [Sporolactobacillus terrae]BBN97921.1 2-dehydro-3-deoxygluconokinase [Sporolactobacillus terrae]
MSKILALGEIMLRLSTDMGDLLMNSNQLNVHYGGAEANVASTLGNFGHQIYFASKLPNSPLADAAIRNLRANAVDTSHVLRGGSRLGVYYLEKGSSLRPSKVIYDRKHSALADMSLNEWDFDQLFFDVRLFHITGITFALAEKWHQFGQHLIEEAYHRGIPVSFDINFRSSMWTLEMARRSICPILPMISYCCANYLDARNFFSIDSSIARQDRMEACYDEVSRKFPNLKAIYATNRSVVSASDNTLQGVLWDRGHFVESPSHRLAPIVDRIGGGDAFVAGILHGILKSMTAEDTLHFAMSAALLKHTIKGDHSLLSEQDVQSWICSSNGEVKR